MHIFCNFHFWSSFQETDFVCFDTGYDKFDNYDIDLLLGSSLEENDGENKGTSDQIQVAEDAPNETQPLADEATDSEKQTEDLDNVPDDQSASLNELDVATEVESDTAATPNAIGRAAEDTVVEQTNAAESVLENVESARSETKDTPTKSEVESVAKDDFVSESEPVTISEGVQIPQLKTTLGTTLDAVITSEEITKSVTPYEEEESEDVENPPEDDVDVEVKTPLLSFSEQSVNTPASNSPKFSEGVQIPESKTTLGTTLDAVITNEEITKSVTPYEEEESKDVENPPEDDVNVEVKTPLLSFSEQTVNTPASDSPKFSEGVQIPELKTTLGATLDAVITDEEITKSVTPYEEEESEDVENPPEDDIDVKAETPLLSFSEETVNTPESHSLRKHESPPATHADKPEIAEKNMWTSFGDAVFSVVTGVEKTGQDLSSDEDDDDEDEEEEAASKTPQSFEEEPQNIEPDLQDPPNFSSLHTDDKETDSDSENVSIDPDDESDGGVIGPGEALEETLKPTDEPIQHQTEASTISMDPVSQDDTFVVPEAQKSDLKTTDEPIEHKEEASKDSEVHNYDAGTQDSSVATEHSEDLDNEVAENRSVSDQESAETERHQHPSPEEMQSENSDVDDGEKTVDDGLANQTRDRLMTDLESNNSQPELSVEEPEIHEELLTEELEEEEKEEAEKEELLEDENALSSSQSDEPETTPPTTSTPEPEPEPEPEYSDSVMRLTLLRDHFAEENMERIQKLLGLKNLFKVEAMFSDLDTELQATRLSPAGTTQDIENALEGILEASENAILDEIEKMLDARDTKHNYDQHMDPSSLDEETEILDDFQELAFSLRQKYSTASDSTPLATEKPSDIDQGMFVFYDFITLI